MKAEFYLTLLDGLLATAVYHPHKPVMRLSQHSCWSVSLTSVRGMHACMSVTMVPSSVDGSRGAFRNKGMRTSATPVCSYRLSLHE